MPLPVTGFPGAVSQLLLKNCSFLSGDSFQPSIYNRSDLWFWNAGFLFKAWPETAGCFEKMLKISKAEGKPFIKHTTMQHWQSIMVPSLMARDAKTHINLKRSLEEGKTKCDFCVWSWISIYSSTKFNKLYATVISQVSKFHIWLYIAIEMYPQ